MLRTAVSIVLALFGLAGAHAQSAWVDRIEIVERGIYRSEIVKSVDDPNLAAGRINVVADVRLIRPTTDVPAQVGVSFGIRYRIVGPRRGDPVSLKMVTRFPAQGLRNPARSETHYRNDYLASRVVGEETTRTYTFEESWEAIPGTWTFEVWQGDRKLAEQSFNVYAP